MKASSVKDLKKELQLRPASELIALCLRLSKFKKENKELLSYLLFEADDEDAFIRRMQEEMQEQFASINTRSTLFIKKGVNKILRNLKTTIRYSGKKETEVELLLYFCAQMKTLPPYIMRNTAMQNLYERQVERVRKVITLLHEDLQYDYTVELERL